MDQKFEKLRNEIIIFLTNKYKLDGEIQSAIPNLDFYFSKQSTQMINILYEPSLCVILQGDKSVGFGNDILSYNSKQYLISSTHLPATMKIVKASEEKPYMSLRIKFELDDIYELLKAINFKEEKPSLNENKGLYFGNMNITLYESIHRLIMLLNRNDTDIKYLYPLITKEILFNLAQTKGGTFLKKFAQIGTNANKITLVINQLKKNYNEKLNIKELANSVDMSESSLYNHFKAITTISPIQFQKNLRLEEAKQLLMLKDIEVNKVAYEVGYESPSQFSREFSRMFGFSPKELQKKSL